MTSRPIVLHFGGNGHAPVRLEPARAVLADRPADERFDLRDVAYPGFAGRAPSADFAGFIEGVEHGVDEALAGRVPALVYASGIGAMIVLHLRSRGRLLGVETVFLGPVLWGLAARRFPRVMRFPGAAATVESVLRTRFVQRKFARTHFDDSVSEEFVNAFFDGYAHCRHFSDLFHWYTPEFLRRMERELPRQPRSLDDIELWWGENDAVVGEREADVTEDALGACWSRRRFPGWGHYPMIVHASEWVAEVHRAVARVPALG